MSAFSPRRLSMALFVNRPCLSMPFALPLGAPDDLPPCSGTVLLGCDLPDRHAWASWGRPAIGETVAVADERRRDLGDGAAAADPESAAAIDPAHAHDGMNAEQRNGAPAQGGCGLGRVGQEVEGCGVDAEPLAGAEAGAGVAGGGQGSRAGARRARPCVHSAMRAVW